MSSSMVTSISLQSGRTASNVLRRLAQNLRKLNPLRPKNAISYCGSLSACSVVLAPHRASFTYKWFVNVSGASEKFFDLSSARRCKQRAAKHGGDAVSYNTADISHVLCGKSAHLFHKICCNILSSPWIFSWRYTISLSAANEIRFVLNRKTMEYKSCCIVGPKRILSFNDSILLERNVPSKTKPVSVVLLEVLNAALCGW